MMCCVCIGSQAPSTSKRIVTIKIDCNLNELFQSIDWQVEFRYIQMMLNSVKSVQSTLISSAKPGSHLGIILSSLGFSPFGIWVFLSKSSWQTHGWNCNPILISKYWHGLYQTPSTGNCLALPFDWSYPAYLDTFVAQCCLCLLSVVVYCIRPCRLSGHLSYF